MQWWQLWPVTVSTLQYFAGFILWDLSPIQSQILLRFFENIAVWFAIAFPNFAFRLVFVLEWSTMKDKDRDLFLYFLPIAIGKVVEMNSGLS